MVYKFDISTTEDDYFQFNLFHQIKTKYGRQSWVMFRMIPLFVFLIFAVIGYFDFGLTAGYFVDLFLIAVVLGVFELLTPELHKIILKSHIKNIKKTGKLTFSETSVMEFCDDKFSETAKDRYAEHTYDAIERVYVNGTQYIYIYVNAQMAYVIPSKSFESYAQRGEFLYFLRTKGLNVEFIK